MLDPDATILPGIGLGGIGVETTAWTAEDRPDAAARAIQVFVHAADVDA